MDEEIFGRMRGPMDEDGFFNPTDLSFLTQPTEQAPVAPPPAPTPAAQPVVPTAPAPSPAPALSALPQGWQETFLTGGLDAGGEGPSGATEEAKHELDEELARRLGFTGTFANYTDLGIELTPEAREFQRQIAEKGYRVAGINAGDKFYTTVFDQSGKALVEPTFREIPDDRLFGLVSNILSAAAGNVMAGGLTAAGMPSALAKGASSYIFSGGDPKAALAGGLGSLASPYIGQVAKAASEAVGGGMLGDITSRAISGAGTSAIGSAVRGGDIGDIGEALLSGGLGGAAGAVSSGLTKDPPLPEPVTRVASAALTNALLGRDVERATVNAIIGEIMRSGSTPSDRPAGESALSQASFLNPDEILATQLPGTISPDIDVVEALLGGIPFSGTDNVLKGTSFVDEGQVLADPVSSELSRASFVRPGEVLSDTVAVGGRDQDIVESLIGQDRAGPSALSKTTFIDADKIAADSVSVGDRDADIIESILGQEKAGASELAKTKVLDEERILTEPIFVGDQDTDLIESILGQTKARESELSKTKFLNEDDIIENEVAEIIGRRTDEEIAEDILRGIDTGAVGPAPAPSSAPRTAAPTPTPTPTPAPAPPPASAPTPAPAPAPKASSFDPALLALLGALMTKQEGGAETYQVADVRGARSPFGSLLGESGTQDDLLRILRG